MKSDITAATRAVVTIFTVVATIVVASAVAGIASVIEVVCPHNIKSVLSIL